MCNPYPIIAPHPAIDDDRSPSIAPHAAIDDDRSPFMAPHLAIEDDRSPVLSVYSSSLQSFSAQRIRVDQIACDE